MWEVNSKYDDSDKLNAHCSVLKISLQGGTVVICLLKINFPLRW